MKTHSDFFSFRKIEKIHNKSDLGSIKYSQLPTFLPKNPFRSHNYLNNSKSKDKSSKKYFLRSNKIPNIKQKNNIKSFSLAKYDIKIDNLFNISNCNNYYNVGPIIKNKNLYESKSLSISNNRMHNNHIKYTAKTLPKNNHTLYQNGFSNRMPFSKPKPNLKRFKLMNDINVLNNNHEHITSTKIDVNKSNNIINNKKLKTIHDNTLQNLLNEKYITYIEAKHSSNPFDVIASYGVNTFKGIIRNYNEDRVSIIVNAKKPKRFISNKNNKWPNISFFGIFDGHAGNKCAEYLKNNLHNYIIESIYFPSSPIKAIQSGFQICEKNFIDSIHSKALKEYLDYSGSCAIVVLIINNECFIANLGDSRAIYSYNTGSEFYQLSRDHKPNDEKEKKRIYQSGGSIFKTNLEKFGLPFGIKEAELGFKVPFRINPGRLAVSTFLII